MFTMIEIIDQLCEERGIKGSKLCDDLGISRSTLTELRKGRAKTLSLQKATLIADYFNVPVSYLLGDVSGVKKPTDNGGLTARDIKDIARDLERLRQDLESADTLMFDGDPMSDEARESILAAMKLGLEAAKIKNKEKYTPKKYKKD